MWDHGAVVAAVAEAGMPQGSAQMRQRYGQGADAFRPLCEDQRKRAGDNISERCGGLSTCFQSLETATSFHEPGSAAQLPERSDRVLATMDRLNGRSAWRAKCLNIPHRRLAEETAVFAVELAGAFVSDLKSRTCCVQTIQEHPSPRCLQPKLFLILKRTHRRQKPDMTVWRENPHPRLFCEIFHPERFRIVRPNPADCFRGPVA